MSFAEAFPASGFQPQPEGGTSQKTSGQICAGSSKQSDPIGSWLRMSLAWGLTIPQENWKRSATPSGRSFWMLRHADADIAAEGLSLWPTPTRTANQNAPSMRKWPTCRAVQDEAGGISPRLWEWQMGFPDGWTDVGN